MKAEVVGESEENEKYSSNSLRMEPASIEIKFEMTSEKEIFLFLEKSLPGFLTKSSLREVSF